MPWRYVLAMHFLACLITSIHIIAIEWRGISSQMFTIASFPLSLLKSAPSLPYFLLSFLFIVRTSAQLERDRVSTGEDKTLQIPL